MYQALNRSLVVPGLTVGCPIATRPKANHCALHDTLVTGVKSIVGADLIESRVRQIPPCGVQQLAQ
jgi:hypothetical protein